MHFEVHDTHTLTHSLTETLSEEAGLRHAHKEKTKVTQSHKHESDGLILSAFQPLLRGLCIFSQLYSRVMNEGTPKLLVVWYGLLLSQGWRHTHGPLSVTHKVILECIFTRHVICWSSIYRMTLCTL